MRLSGQTDRAPGLVRGVARVAGVTSSVAESVGDVLERVHRQISPPMGDLCMALERRRARIDAVRYWAWVLRQGARGREKLAESMESRS